jgi:hypothetical protein
MRWTRRPCQASEVDADGEIVRSRSPDAGIKFAADDVASDGGQKARRTEEITYKP